MKLNTYLRLLAMAFPLSAAAQTSIQFENTDYQRLGVYDSWEASPFRTGALQGNVAVVKNHLNAVDPMLEVAPNASGKVLAFQRSRFASNTFGARIDLKNTFELTKDLKYVHVLIHKPKEGRVMLIGLGKRKERAGQSPEAEQFWALSTSKVTAGAWCDAVFPIKGAGGIDIHSLVVVPDCESTHDLDQDFAVYIDDIVINNDASSRIVRGEYIVNVDENQAYTRNDRHLDGIALNGSADGNQQVAIPAPRKVYTKSFDKVLKAKAGETLTPVFQYTGNWMNGYVYLDMDQNGRFDVKVNENGTIPAGSEILAFSHLDGYNSKGEAISNANVLNPPAFTLPKDLPNGIYRLRYKVDWSSADPAGRVGASNSMLDNGGAICDVLLNVHGDYCNVNDANRNGEVLAENGDKLVKYKVPFGKPFTIKMNPENGFTYDGIRLRHGYNLAGDSLVHGNLQYREVVIPAYLFKDDKFTIPAEYMDGDIEIEGLFIEVSGDTGKPQGEEYALNFDKETLRQSFDCKLSGVSFRADKGGSTSWGLNSKDSTVYHSLLNKEVSVVPGDVVKITPNCKGSGLHYYLYVDLNNDGYFTPMLKDKGEFSLSSELVSYSFYKGYNSLGEEIESPATVAMNKMPSFRISEFMPLGVYRARLKVDYDNIDPAGQWKEGEGQQIASNGGYIVDFLLNVHADKHPVTVVSTNGSIHGPGNTGLPAAVRPFTSLPVVPYAAATGYEADSLIIKHGHNFDGPQYVHGNRQWSEYVVKARSYTIPKDSVNGDMHLTVHFNKGERAVYELVFADEFNGADGSQPDASKWSRCPRQGSTWNRWLSDSEEVVYLKDGNLVTRAIPNPDQKNDPVPMITGGIQSQKKFGFTYGKVECRAKINTWTGTFPAIWMMPEDQRGGWPDCGEIDIFECIDNEGRSYHTVHSNWTYDLNQKNNPRSSFSVPVDFDRYHTYGLEWNEKQLRWYVDGKQVGSYSKSTNSDHLSQGQWPFDKHFYLILNQSVGNGSWAAHADVNHTYEFFIDWVRVYQKKGMENTDGLVGIHDVYADDNLDVSVVKGGIQLQTATSTLVKVHDLQGRCLYAQNVDGTAFVRLNTGVYLVNGKKMLVH